MKIKKQNMTYIINNLEKKEFIKRFADINDRRLVKIKITNEGKEFLNQWQKNALVEMKNNLSTLRNDDLELLLNSIQSIKIVLSKLTYD